LAFLKLNNKVKINFKFYFIYNYYYYLLKMDNSDKEEQIFKRFDLDDKKEEPFQEIINTN
jgi:hypothetical protein